jgi:hypothetical protein
LIESSQNSGSSTRVIVKETMIEGKVGLYVTAVHITRHENVAELSLCLQEMGGYVFGAG